MGDVLRSGDLERAARLYREIDDDAARAWLDFLIDHPGEVFDSETLQARLGFDEHRRVALSAYAIGELAAADGLARPWEEGQRGYVLPATQAELLRQVRASVAS
jgi:hypothetical protein